MKSKQAQFGLAVIAIIVIVIGLGVVSQKTQKPGKYDNFAKALKDGGAQFYGAFWCTHCQAQEKEFEMTRQKLESIGLYKECSNPDQSLTPICKEKKIESYPTWMFKDGITLKNVSKPVVCKVNPKHEVIPSEPSQCIPQMTSAYYKTYIFPEYKFSIKSEADPVVKDGVWKFGIPSETTGELPLDFLANQISYTLPQ